MDHTTRWEKEREYFDNEEYSTAALPPAVVKRYSECQKPFLAPEFNHFILGDVRGKRVLDVGCGDGGNSILLALRGATVVGVDISPRAIEAATKRAAMHGISDRVKFVATPFELFTPLENEKFDVVCGWAILHHLIPVLDPMVECIVNFAKPGGLVIFVEPIALWGWLRKFRLMLPIAVNGTPDERPLETAEFAVLRKHLPNLKAEYHNATVRFANRFLTTNYENMNPVTRGLYDSLARTDHFLLNTLGMNGLASEATLYGNVRK